jgi:hypothetical protein
LVLGAASLTSTAALAQAPSDYERPSVTIVGLDLSPNVQRGLDAFCAQRCAGTAIGDRLDVNALGRWSYTSGVAGLVNLQNRTWATTAPATIQGLLGTSGVTRNTLRWLFNVASDFNWNLDTLAARARYAITVEEAQRLLRAQRGVTRNELRQVLPTYFFVFAMVGDSVSTSGSLYGATGKLLGAVYRLGYPDVAAAGAALTPVSCFRADVPPTCTDADRDARRAAFERYEPPLVLVTSFAEPVVVIAASSEAQAWQSLAGTALGTMVSKTVAADARFASQGRVIASNPVASRIGRKEGVSSNSSRFLAMRRDSTPGRPARSVRVGAFIAKRVADNRQVVFVAGPNGSQIARLDSSTFVQIHGGTVLANRGIQLRETRYWGSISFGGLSIDDQAGLMGQYEYRVPGLPVGSYAGLAGSFYSVTEGDLAGVPVTLQDSTTLTRVGLVFGQEFFPARGYLRFRLQLEGGKGFVKAGTSTQAQSVDAGFYGGGAATLALAPGYRWNLFASVLYLKRFVDCDLNLCVGPEGVGFAAGIRIEP